MCQIPLEHEFCTIERQISVVCLNCLPDLILQGILVIRLQEIIALEDFIFCGFPLVFDQKIANKYHLDFIITILKMRSMLIFLH